MPVEGFKTITVAEKTYKDLATYAKKTKRSIPQAIEFLLERETKK